MKNASELFKRMSGLNADNSRFDMHLHTTWTDGRDSAESMIAAACENHLTSIAFTDHIRKGSDYYPDYLDELASYAMRDDIRVYRGFEAKIMNPAGEVDIPDDARSAADIVVASVHRIPVGDSFVYPKELPYELLAKTERDLALAAVRRGRDCNVVGHCGGMTISAYGTFPVGYFEEVIRECAEADIAFEYNYKYHVSFENEIKELLVRYDPFVSAGSDAHDTKSVADRSFIIG
ncbi:MAG: PHP domain-containing protein [Lachnospiraceae bacterium]|nr:PHP domain-containing protein [Lachnospiraceae bacterium]